MTHACWAMKNSFGLCMSTGHIQLFSWVRHNILQPANGEPFGFGSAFGDNQESDPFGATESSGFGFGSGSGSRGGRRNDGGKGCFKASVGLVI